MAAPTPTARGTPAGIPLPDRHSTLITFATNDVIKFWEKSVTPPGIDGGDAVETHTMHNTVWRTMASRTLQTMTEASASVAYDPATYDEIIALINVETTITVTFADGSTLAFFGYLRTFEPDECVEGTQPTATITIQPTNRDTVTPFAEEGPVIYDAVGT